MSNNSQLVAPEAPPRLGRPGFLVAAGLALRAADTQRGAHGGTSVKPLPDDSSCISQAVPPKRILAVLPAAALPCMSAADLATVWWDATHFRTWAERTKWRWDTGEQWT